MKPGPLNSICDVAGLSVGNVMDDTLKSGVSVVLCEKPAIASVAIHGGGPGTRDTELLSPENTVERVDAIVLSGGSAFGLDAASGVQAKLREMGRGYPVGDIHVPIVPGAILFDMINGGNKDWGKFPPYRDMGWQAVETASQEFQTGSHGAGCGALVAGLKGGLGTASAVSDNGITLAALVAVNALGSPLIGEAGHFWAAPFEMNGEFGDLGLPSPLPKNSAALNLKHREPAAAITNTTIAIIATDAVLSKAEAKRLAIAAHDGIARAIWPAHTPFDGDLVFCVATGGSGTRPSGDAWTELGAHAASVLSRAIACGVYDATPAAGDLFATWKEKFGKQ